MRADGLRLGVRALAATALVAVIGVVARRHPFAFRTGRSDLVKSDTLATVGATVLAVGGLAILVLALAFRGAGAMPVRQHRRPWWVSVIWFVAIVSLLWMAPKATRRSLSLAPAGGPSRRSGHLTPSSKRTAGPARAAPIASSALLVILIGGAATALLLTSRRTPPRPGAEDDPPPGGPAALPSDLQLGWEVMARQPDVRQAIIGAFAAMEVGLAGRGLTRQPTETAVEFVARVLRDAAAPAEPVRGLTNLFEEARYSAHPLDESHRGRALEQVREIQAALS